MSEVFGRDPANDRDKPIEPITAETVKGRELTVEEWHQDRFMKVNKSPRACNNYRRPEGVMGGPCLGCGRSQPEHVHRHVKAMDPQPISPASAMAEYLAAGSTPMILKCPVCKGRHIDEPNEAIGWTNPPHKTHLCTHCGHLWRPHEYPTVGVSDEDWLAFMGSLTDDDWKEALKMANDMIPQQAVLISELKADGFEKICYQMPLYARFMKEPADQVDHIRLWYVDEAKKIAQGDSIPWTSLIENILTLMRMPKHNIEHVISMIREQDLDDGELPGDLG